VNIQHLLEDYYTQSLIKDLQEQGKRGETGIALAVEMLDIEICDEMADKAMSRYKSGEMIKDGSRQRTLGGCFFVQLDKDVKKEIKRVRKELPEGQPNIP